MGKIFEGIDAALARWIARQPMFFVATAPLSADGLVNLSPRGLDCFSVLDEHTVDLVARRWVQALTAAARIPEPVATEKE